MAKAILVPLWAAKAPRRTIKFARQRAPAFATRARRVNTRSARAAVMRPSPRLNNDFTLRTVR